MNNIILLVVDDLRGPPPPPTVSTAATSALALSTDASTETLFRAATSLEAAAATHYDAMIHHQRDAPLLGESHDSSRVPMYRRSSHGSMWAMRRGYRDNPNLPPPPPSLHPTGGAGAHHNPLISRSPPLLHGEGEVGGGGGGGPLWLRSHTSMLLEGEDWLSSAGLEEDEEEWMGRGSTGSYSLQRPASLPPSRHSPPDP